MSNDIINRARAGDKQAFAQLYTQQKDKLYRYAFFKLGNAQDAQDAVSGCIAEAYAGITQLKSEKAFSSWIFKILYRQCCALISYRTGLAPEQEMPAFCGDSHIALELKEALAILSPEDRDIVLLSAVAGYKTREIADMLHLNHATVRSKLSRALAKMRNYLE